MVIEVENLSKTYGDVCALNDFSAVFSEGVYGILGPNGAGKSTLMGLMTDNVKREKGQILCDGKDILKLGGKFRSQVGYMPQQLGFYNQFTAENFLKYMAGVKGLNVSKCRPQIKELLKLVNLEKEACLRVGGFSGGMKQRLLLAQALLGDPKLLILDEPTAGLDPGERIAIRNYIAEMSKKRIILFATHVVGDIECIANEILLIKDGCLIKKDTPQNLISGLTGKVGEVLQSEIKEEHSYHVGTFVQHGNGIWARVVGDRLPDGTVVLPDQMNLEDVYLYYLAN